ncbi:hypothetical protein QYE76_003176 [Lolium multiflorum]|uniref:RING-type domain-containing protein n=1 Tax=Lolium multiflorum TaxID=4521 RepID=A0AAD8W1B4_LOLMU|nr:hypothetical protein QYE76_003176 [Lolium multiflorum]
MSTTIIYEEVVEESQEEYFHRSLLDWALGRRVPWIDYSEQRREEDHEEEGPFRLGPRVPASREAVKELKAITWAAAGARLQTECAVCLKDFEAEDMVSKMPCDHCFHHCCISQWLRVSCVCPLCRHALPTA